MDGADIASLILRVAIGGTMLAHGWNHAFRGGRLPGTGRWFESIGLRPGRLHALMANGTELGAGVLLVLGALTPLAAAGVAGTMLVALLPNHLRDGFFGTGREPADARPVCHRLPVPGWPARPRALGAPLPAARPA